ncbi:afadin- and alpha-actinin-binding protein-like [Diretmus argenteus]
MSLFICCSTFLSSAFSSTSCFCRPSTSPLRQFSQSSLLPVPRNPYMLSAFCTEDNVPECLSHINQEVSSLGLPPVWTESGGGSLALPLVWTESGGLPPVWTESGGLPPVWTESGGCSQLSAVAVLNSMYDLIQLHRRDLRTLEDIEGEQLKISSSVDYLQLTNTRLKEQLEVSQRDNTALVERERQLQLKVRSLQSYLKNEKEEVQKLQNIISSRASQYNHDLKRKEREFNKLKERLSQLLVDRKEKKPAIDVFNYIGRADGKRSLWKTVKTEAKHEGEMYKTLLSDYDGRQKQLVLENAELRKVLQQMKRDIVSILSSRKPTPRGWMG